MKQVTGVILAGGNSSRMGQNKALLPFRGRTLIEHIAERLGPYCQRMLISVKERESLEFLGLPMIMDHKVDCGPLAGIESALLASKTELCFVVPCDLPFFSGAVVPLLTAQINKADACVPVLNNYYEPLVALYAKSALPEISKALADEKYKIADLFTSIVVKKLTEEYFVSRKLEGVFQNINTFSEYKKLAQV